MLLLHIPGTKSFEELQIVDGIQCDTFKEACVMLGLLKDDMQWHKAMAEAASFQMPYQLRRMFVIILTHYNPHPY